MNTLKATRLIHCLQWGKRDYREGRPLIVPVFLKDKMERDSYAAGYRAAESRDTSKRTA